MTEQTGGPNIPEPRHISLDPGTTAVAVLDLTTRCLDPDAPCGALLSRVGEFLGRARVAGAPIAFTVSLRDRGTPRGIVAPSLGRLESESVVSPDSFDKFFGGDLHDVLRGAGAESLVIVGAATNVAVMYTATAAARVYKYDVVIPIDGVAAASRYENDYALHQLHALPGESVRPVRFTTLADITFQRPKGEVRDKR